MRISYPEGEDRLGVTLSLDEHNASTDERSLRPSDLAQAIRAVERWVGFRSPSDPASVTARLAALEEGSTAAVAVDLTGIEGRLTILEAAAASTVSGTGTTNRLAVWSASNALAAGPVSVSGNNITLLGTLTFPSGPIAQTYDANTLRIGNSYIGTNLETSQISHYANVRVLNKASNGWISWATRSTARNESEMMLANIGQLYMQNTATAATNNVLGVDFYLRNDAAAEKLYGYVRLTSTKINAGAEGATMNLAVLDNAGAMHTPLQVSAFGVIINKRTYMYEGGIDVINKAGSGWLAFVSRNTAGAEAVMNLAAVGSITASGNFQTGTSGGFISGTLPGGVSNFFNNWNSNVGLLLRRTSTGTGRPIVAQNSSSADIFEVSADGSVVSQGDVKAGSGKKFYIGTAPHTVVESASTRAPSAAVYDGGLGVNTNSSRSRFLLRGNATWREVLTGHWERKTVTGISAATGTTLTLANSYPSGSGVIPLAFWEDADGNLNWCRLVRNVDGNDDLISVTAYPADDGATVHIFMYEPDAAQ